MLAAVNRCMMRWVAGERTQASYSVNSLPSAARTVRSRVRVDVVAGSAMVRRACCCVEVGRGISAVRPEAVAERE